MTTYLSRDDILNAQDFRTDEVDVPEWGGTVLVRELSALEMLKVRFRVYEGEDAEGRLRTNRAKYAENIPAMISWCVVDERGVSILSIDDVNRLSAKSVRPADRIIAKIMKLSRLAEAENEGEDEDTEAKNE